MSGYTALCPGFLLPSSGGIIASKHQCRMTAVSGRSPFRYPLKPIQNAPGLPGGIHKEKKFYNLLTVLAVLSGNHFSSMLTVFRGGLFLSCRSSRSAFICTKTKPRRTHPALSDLFRPNLALFLKPDTACGILTVPIPVQNVDPVSGEKRYLPSQPWTIARDRQWLALLMGKDKTSPERL